MITFVDCKNLLQHHLQPKKTPIIKSVMKTWYYNFLTWSYGIRSSQTTSISKLDVFCDPIESDSIKGYKHGQVDKKTPNLFLH
jgi:hypothetical protein